MTDKQRENAASLVVASIAGNLSNKTWLSGISNMMEAVSDPDRSWGRFVNNTVASIAVPAIVSQTARANDPLIREARTITDTIRSRVPGLSSDLPIRRDVLGNAMRRPDGLGPNIASPVRTGTALNDPTVRALLAAGIGLSYPSRQLGGRKGRTLDGDEYSRYQEEAGAIMKPRLDALVRDPDWQANDDDGREEAVRTLVKRAREDARLRLALSAAPRRR